MVAALALRSGGIASGATSRLKGVWNHLRGVQTLAETRGGLPNYYVLPSGDKIPSVALGCWRAREGEVGNAVKTALKAGYRHIDGAWAYENEAEVGEPTHEHHYSLLIRIQKQLWNSYHYPEDVAPILEDSLQKLGVDYIDLYLIHFPVAFKKERTPEGKPVADLELTENTYATWQAMEKLVDSGKVRNIGVSNFNIRRLTNLTSNPLKYQPAVNQVELSFGNPQPELLAWSKKNGILLEAYSPLGSTEQVKQTLQIPEVVAIANELGITPAQVLISWHVQRGTVVLPKSVTPSRVEQNFQIFKLPQDKFDALEKAAVSHPPKRVVDPSGAWGVNIYEDQ
ncbi:hypothetical protein SISSUDRAFT_1062454 [Sistotremastrum suecicum HHB10207 ss-3]|uniref:NADP-dependent oxidoreductase domain-containing protein n=1 Tax=Sistotremastrum suecicum HHB10207 ss-3 TaxID=1314776 RepID=A0A166CW19_9AGAM|nr:hypothetical protein SISSUDRAFT_1062454 [Sistotremastrum suecicum HHB10207 ss-3]